MKTRIKATKESQELRKAQLPHLPGEIWRGICRLLTTKEIARALGPSCMALHELPLDYIYVTSCPTKAISCLAFEWMMKHMHGASEVTYIHLRHYSSKFMKQPQKTLDIIRKQGCGELSNLQKLKLDLDNNTPNAWTAWLDGMLGLAPNLVVLELRLVTCPRELPPFQNLRHLDLALADTDRGLSFCLSSMHSLKTLGLRGTSVCPRGMNVSLELPPSLERLCLSQVLPTNGLTLPAGCQVFLAGKACNLNDDKKQEGWKALRPAVTKLVTHAARRRFEWEVSVGAVLPHLQALTLIALEQWEEKAPGVPDLDHYLGPHMEDIRIRSLPGEQLSHLTSLTIVATELCITLPSAPRLKRLCLCAHHELCLHFESAEETARHLQALDITFRHLLHQEPLNALQTALMQKGIRLAHVIFVGSERQHIRSNPRSDADTCWYRECGCMCCSECLARSRVTTEQGYNGDKSTATPRALRDILSHMSYLEGGCEKARTWTPEIRWRCSRGLPSLSHSQLCIDTIDPDYGWDETDEHGGFGPPDDYIGINDDYPGPSDNTGYTGSMSAEEYYATL